MFFNKLLVEFIGTTFFCYIILVVGNPYAICAALLIAILLGGNISGGMYNPAVSLMMTTAGKLKISEFGPYILSQLFGALAAFHLSKIKL